MGFEILSAAWNPESWKAVMRKFYIHNKKTEKHIRRLCDMNKAKKIRKKRMRTVKWIVVGLLLYFIVHHYYLRRFWENSRQDYIITLLLIGFFLVMFLLLKFLWNKRHHSFSTGSIKQDGKKTVIERGIHLRMHFKHPWNGNLERAQSSAVERLNRFSVYDQRRKTSSNAD